jgi:hypothetical protein
MDPLQSTFWDGVGLVEVGSAIAFSFRETALVRHLQMQPEFPDLFAEPSDLDQESLLGIRGKRA